MQEKATCFTNSCIHVQRTTDQWSTVGSRPISHIVDPGCGHGVQHRVEEGGEGQGQQGEQEQAQARVHRQRPGLCREVREEGLVKSCARVGVEAGENEAWKHD